MKVKLNEEDKKLFERLAGHIVARRLTAVAVFYLESSKPLSFIGSQLMVFFQPFVQTFFDIKEYDRIMILMEDRDNVELFIQYIENAEADRKKIKKVEKKEKKSKTSK